MPLAIPKRIKENLELGDRVWLKHDPDHGQGEIINIDETNEGVPLFFVEFSKVNMAMNAFYKGSQLCECLSNY